MSAANDKAGLRAAGWSALIEERDRIARQAEDFNHAIRAMQRVREQMLDRLLAIMVELQRRDALGADTNNGDAK